LNPSGHLVQLSEECAVSFLTQCAFIAITHFTERGDKYMDVSMMLAVPDPYALGNAFGKITFLAIIVLVIILLIRSGKNRGKGSK